MFLRKDKRSSEDQGPEIRLNYNITVYDQRFAFYDWYVWEWLYFLWDPVAPLSLEVPDHIRGNFLNLRILW